MHRSNGTTIYSAYDLVGFLECEHIAALDLINLDTPLPRAPPSEEAVLLQEKGRAHETRYADILRKRHASFIDLSGVAQDSEKRLALTREAMHAGAEVIFQGALSDEDFIGYPDFLRRVEQPSSLGAYGYEVLDTKLARSTKSKFIIQLAFYSSCVAHLQGREPMMMHVVLGDQSEQAFRYGDFARYVTQLRCRFEDHVKLNAGTTYPDPCDYCDLCKWRLLCEARRTADDHLSQVANITRVQTRKLQACGVDTLEELGSLDAKMQIPAIVPATLQRIRQQARLQLEARRSGARKYELLKTEGEGRGLARLPRPSPGDLFFDIESAPYEENGLDYLLGVHYYEGANPQYKAFWAHTRTEEKQSFEAFMDFATARLRKYPQAHIYHYAQYEPTALKRLMSTHGTREADLDNWLRAGKLVDLYLIVREGLRISEPRYSLKNIENFYCAERTTEVKSAVASIVHYEHWKETADPQLLKDIETYNHDDVRSAYELRQWLLSLRPANLSWPDHSAKDGKSAMAIGELTQAERRLIPYRRALLETLPVHRETWSVDDQVRELAYYLLDFHRRADKPAWWAMFARMDMSTEELLEDAECLAGLRLVHPVLQDDNALIWRYRYPQQETKLKTGDDAVLIGTGESFAKIRVDSERREVRIRRRQHRQPLPERIDLGPGRPIDTSAIRDAVFRFCDSLLSGVQKYHAIEAFLRQEIPRIQDHAPGQPIIADADLTVSRIADVIARLQGSYLFVQGPPGAGKTYTGSHAIVELLRRGYRVGVSSNGHKAINNLLQAVEDVAKKSAFEFLGAKKSTRGDEESHLNGSLIEDVFNKEDIDLGAHQLVAGTAWLFSDPALDQTLDFLFVDEAGQVALANLVAIGTSARNLVLLGDQMQLGQPVRGIHPGQSGQSSLEYLLQGKATIPPDRGIFLKTTWRMHPDVCRFVSDAVYDSRLQAEPQNVHQGLLLNRNAHPALKPTGISFLEVHHDACSQESEEEARIVQQLVENLLQQRYRDKRGLQHPLQLADILIVAPYNMQVNLLKYILPGDARVGTVDKFQGQEAEVVIMSMTTSSGEYLPKFVDFLYSKNRFNVAISRARSLAIVLANPSLLSVPCRSPADMALVNTLCWIRDYARDRAA